MVKKKNAKEEAKEMKEEEINSFFHSFPSILSDPWDDEHTAIL